ncbi:hypothetical protein KR009_002972 [Drosophila setifemur]|nr:hypothetical protein KR009_002972 [Drosophila setifemur]
MPAQPVRPVSTYDNLGAGSSTQLQRQTIMYEPELEPDPAEHSDPNGANSSSSSHSIAAVKAALNDAKSKFFGINNYESPAGTGIATTPLKPEPKYQNVPQRNFQRDESSPAAPMLVSTPSAVHPTNDLTPSGQDKGLRYASTTTYEQIPLSDLDAPQPSQAVYMSTTVPQNMKGVKIAGRHTPTRNSLRHSRMIVVNHKNHDTLQASYSNHIRNLNISRQLLIMQLAVGLLIVALSIWILFLAPLASILINPYLSGLSLLLASVAGLILLRRDYGTEHRPPPNNCYKVLLAESYVFSALALIFCCLALVCAAIEFAELTTTSSANGDVGCGPATSSLLSYRNCSCFAAGEDVVPLKSTTALATAEEPSMPSAEDEEGCGAFRVKWKYLLAFSMALNSLGIVATFLYITLFICCHRNRKHFYTSV